MSIILRNLVASAAVGFMIPTLTFAAIEQPPSLVQPKYLFELSYSDVEQAVAFALGDRGAGGKISTTITGRRDGALFSYNKPVNVELRGLQFDKSVGRWSANLLLLSEGTVVSAMPVAGRFEEISEIAVLKRQVRAGDVITQDDVEIRDYATSRTRSDTITDLAGLIGKSPVRTISPGRPIYTQEIAQPTVVEKNSVVQMHYSSPGVSITATGQALEDGSAGSIISVRNLASNKTVRAVVNDKNTVTILVPGLQAGRLSIGDHYAAN